MQLGDFFAWIFLSIPNQGIATIIEKKQRAVLKKRSNSNLIFNFFLVITQPEKETLILSSYKSEPLIWAQIIVNLNVQTWFLCKFAWYGKKLWGRGSLRLESMVSCRGVMTASYGYKHQVIRWFVKSPTLSLCMYFSVGLNRSSHLIGSSMTRLLLLVHWLELFEILLFRDYLSEFCLV